MPDEDTPDVEGADDAALIEDASTDAPVDEVEEQAPEPETYTREQLVEALGPRFAERFATHHDGLDAFRQLGQAYESASGLIRQGAHLEPQDPSIYEQIGLDPNEVFQPEPEPEGLGIFGAPWEQPTTWDEIEAYWDNAYGQGAYKQAVMQQQLFQEQQAELRQQIKDELLAEIGPIQTTHTNTYVDGMLAQARAEIPGFQDHEAGIALLMQERERKFPGYKQAFESSDMQTQLAEFHELTLIAASRATPSQRAAAEAAANATDEAKQRARTETSRTNGQPSDAAALKQQSLDEAKRVFGHVR